MKSLLENSSVWWDANHATVCLEKQAQLGLVPFGRTYAVTESAERNLSVTKKVIKWDGQ